MLIFFGAAFACFGIAVSVSRLFPGWFGWVAVVGAGGSVVAALLQSAASGEVQAAETMFLASSVLLTLWAFALGVLMWRGRMQALATGPALAPTLADYQP